MNEEKYKIEEISKYISKDFSKTGIDSLITKDNFDNLEEFRLYLSSKIKEMMDTNFSKLINTLYLIDVSEEKVNQLFDVKNKEFIPAKLADLIIERQLQKFFLRQKYKRGEL